MTFYLITILVLGLLLVFFLYQKKGTIAHELLHLPEYWYHVLPIPIRHLKRRRMTYGKHRRQYLWYFPPIDTSISPKKIIIWFHGGGWAAGSAEHFTANAKVWLEEGYAVFLPSYRLLPRHNYYSMREDLNLSIVKILGALEEEGYADVPLIVGGMSAGANLAALLAYDRNTLKQIGLSPSLFAGVMLFGAPLDMEKMLTTPVTWGYAGRKGSTRNRAASPINYIDSTDVIPTLIVQGDRDGLVQYGNVTSFCEKMKELCPDNLTVHWLKDGTHLDAVRWTYRNDEVRQVMLNWIRVQHSNSM